MKFFLGRDEKLSRLAFLLMWGRLVVNHSPCNDEYLTENYLFAWKNACMRDLHSSSNTPDVTVVFGWSALGAYLE